jgi:Tol biopolymer transport system component
VAVPAQARGERARRAAPLRGAWVAYAVRPAIRLVRLDGTGDHMLVPKIAGDQEHPDWSPDGSKIVFQLDFKSLWVVGADGSDPHAVYRCRGRCSSVQDAAWSPDGRTIAFSTTVTTVPGGSTLASSSIMALDVAGGRVRTIMTTARARDIAYSPRWSPDGRRLVAEVDAFTDAGVDTVATTGAWISVVPARGGGRARAITSRTGRAGEPDWGPRGIVYTVGREFTATEMNAILIQPDGSGRRAITHMHLPAERALQASWTPDGNRLIFTYVRQGDWSRPTYALIRADGTHLMVGRTSIPITHPRLRPLH